MLHRLALLLILATSAALLTGCPPREYASALRQPDSL